MTNDAVKKMKTLLNTMRLIMEGKEPGRDMNYWEWNSGVGLFGVMKAYEKTNEDEYFQFMKDWFDRNGGDDRYRGSVNCVIPCCMALALYRITGDERCRAVCDEYADWAQNISVKTQNGGIAHVWSIGGIEDYKNQLWADSVFMAGIFLVAYAKEIDDKDLMHFAVSQVKIHIESLFDKEAGLFNHGYHALEYRRLGGFWGRGNGWIAAALAEIMCILGPDAENGYFKNIFVKFIEHAYSLREKNGMLHTLLDEPESYTEATASMLFGYGAYTGYELGILDERFFEWSKQIYEALEFDDDGTVKACSGGTDCFLELNSYFTIPCVKSNYADGITLMFLSKFAN